MIPHKADNRVLTDSQRERITALESKRGRFKGIPLISGAIPFVPISVAAAVSAAVALYKNTIDNQIQMIEAEDVSDTRYETETLTPGVLPQQTYFGHAIPMTVWKSIMKTEENKSGYLSPHRRREIMAQLLEQGTLKPFALSDNLLTRHLACMGLTGIGKTELIKSIAYQQIFIKRGGMILIEAKSDSDLSGTIYQMCKDADRLDDFYLINFEQPELSHKYNPFASGGVRELIAASMRIQGSSSEEFWNNINRYMFTAAILALKSQPDSPGYTISDFVAVLQDFGELLRLIKQIDKKQSEEHRAAYEWLVLYLDYWRDKVNGGFREKEYANFSTGAVSKFSAFTHSEYRSIVNTYVSDVDILDCILTGKVLVLSMSTMKDKDGVEQFARLFMADVARAIGTIQQDKLKPLTTCPLICDEYGSFADLTHIDFFQLARSANVPCLIMMQGKGFLDVIDENFSNNVLGNCWHHIYFDVRDIKTREYAAALAGTHMTRLRSVTVGESAGVSLSSEESGLLTNDSESRSQSDSWREQKEELIQPDDFISMDEGDAIMVGKSGVYRLRMPLVEVPSPPHWNEMQLVRRHKIPKKGVDVWSRRVKSAESSLQGIFQ